jgi:hypothetical protein
MVRFATFAGIGAVVGLSFCPSAPDVSPHHYPLLNQNQTREQEPKAKEPTFEETKAFLLKYTSRAWQESPGNRHAYTLAFVNKRLKYSHKFTSDFVPGYLEKIDVALSDLDPTQVGKRETTARSISLATTNGERKISVEVTTFASVDGSPTRKYTDRTMSVPGSDQETPEEQEQMDARLKKAWAHLITLAGGKPSQGESF